MRLTVKKNTENEKGVSKAGLKNGSPEKPKYPVSGYRGGNAGKKGVRNN